MAAAQDQGIPQFVPLATARLVLRPPRPEDAEALFRLVNDWAVVRMLSRLPFPYPRPLMDEWIFGAGRQAEAGTGYHLVVTETADPARQAIGCVGLTIDPAARVGKLGYWVGRRHWGRGVATEAVGRVARWALDTLDLQRIEAHAALILSTYEARPEIFLHELRDALAERGVATSTSGLSRFFARHRITRKKGRSTRPSRRGRT